MVGHQVSQVLLQQNLNHIKSIYFVYIYCLIFTDVRGIDNVKYEDEQLTVEYVELVSSESNQGTEQSTEDIKKAVMCYIVRASIFC
jgi:hypothetical protein